MKTTKQQKVLVRQLSEWMDEIKRLSGLIAAAKGRACVVVLITPHDEDYADVIPELITEDAFDVSRMGWPEGFEIETLNPAT